MAKTKSRFKRAVFVCSLALFILALTEKSYCTNAGCGDSAAVFLAGVLGVYYGGACLVWLANPIFILSWVLNEYLKWSILLSFIALLIALSFLRFNEIIDDEGGNIRQIISYQNGYWFWIASMVVTFIGNILRYIRSITVSAV